MLLEQRESVLSEMKQHQLAGADRDPEVQAEQAVETLVEGQITSDDRNLLKKIEFALERLDAGTYELCVECGKTIPLERLEAKPSVSLCLGCQEAKDSGAL